MRFDLVDQRLFLHIAEARSITHGAERSNLALASATGLAANPTISLDIEDRESADIGAAIASGAADVGIASITALPDTLEQFPFRKDLLVVVIPRGDPLGQRRQLALADVVDAAFVGLPRDSALQRHIDGHATRLGATLNVRARVTSLDAVCRMVEARVGLGIVPEVSARRCLRGMSIEIVRLSDPWAKRRLAMCVNRLDALPAPARRLVDHLRIAAS